METTGRALPVAARPVAATRVLSGLSGLAVITRSPGPIHPGGGCFLPGVGAGVADRGGIVVMLHQRRWMAGMGERKPRRQHQCRRQHDPDEGAQQGHRPIAIPVGGIFQAAAFLAGTGLRHGGRSVLPGQGIHQIGDGGTLCVLVAGGDRRFHTALDMPPHHFALDP